MEWVTSSSYCISELKCTQRTLTPPHPSPIDQALLYGFLDFAEKEMEVHSVQNCF